jgi:hypothetical protein
MKKLLFIPLLITILSGCYNTTTTTTTGQDMQMLQSKYPFVYRLHGYRYITADSAHMYDVTIEKDGKISSIVKIK